MSLAVLMCPSVASMALSPKNSTGGTVAVKTPEGIFIGWRSLSTDGDSTFFDLYRDGEKINPKPLSVTNWVDQGRGPQHRSML